MLHDQPTWHQHIGYHLYPYRLDGICFTTVCFTCLLISYQGANWDPEGRVALLSFSNSTTLGSIHFSSKQPSLGMYRYPWKKFVAKAMCCTVCVTNPDNLPFVPFLQMPISYQSNFQKFPP